MPVVMLVMMLMRVMGMVTFTVMMVFVMVMLMGIATRSQFVTTRRQIVEPSPLERILWLQKCRVHRQRAIEIESADVEHTLDGDIGIAGSENFRSAIDRTNTSLDTLELRFAHEIDLVEQDHISESNLLAGLLHFIEMLLDVMRINDGDDRVEQELLLKLIVEEKRLRDRTWIRHAGRFDDDVVELIATLEELPQNAQQVAAHGAADASVVGFEDFFFGTNDELVIDTHLTEFVFDDSDTLAVILGENAVEQRGLSRPQKSRQDGDGHPIRGSHIATHDNVRHGQNRRITRLCSRPPELYHARSRHGRRSLRATRTQPHSDP